MLIVPPFYDGLSGIITLLNQTYHQKYKDYIKAYPSTTNPLEGRIAAEALIQRDYSNHKMHWCSENTPNSFVVFHFPHHFIKLSQYTMKSRSNSMQPYPTGWKLEAANSNNENTVWTLLHEIGPVNDINGDGLQKTYPSPSNDYFCYFKLTQTSATSAHHFCFAKIEFFGDLKGGFPGSCRSSLFTIHYFLHFIFFISF